MPSLCRLLVGSRILAAAGSPEANRGCAWLSIWSCSDKTNRRPGPEVSYRYGRASERSTNGADLLGVGTS